MKIITIILFCGLCSMACHNRNVVNIQTMAYIMSDMHLADAYAAYIYQQDTSANHRNALNKNMDTLRKYYSVIFETNKIKEADFIKNLNEYQTNPILWDSLYSLIQKRLTALQPKKN
jgi:Domain of unknown function (DUF4296)